MPSAPPRKVEAEALNATAIRVLWRSPAPGRQHGQIRGYQVHYVRMEGAEARGPPRIKDVMLADAQVGRAPGRGLGAGWGPGPCAPAISLLLCPSLRLLCSPTPLSPAASSRAQWEMDDTAEYVSSAFQPWPGLFPRAVRCCDPTPALHAPVKGSPTLGPRCIPNYLLELAALILHQTNGTC